MDAELTFDTYGACPAPTSPSHRLRAASLALRPPLSLPSRLMLYEPRYALLYGLRCCSSMGRKSRLAEVSQDISWLRVRDGQRAGSSWLKSDVTAVLPST